MHRRTIRSSEIGPCLIMFEYMFEQEQEEKSAGTCVPADFSYILGPGTLSCHFCEPWNAVPVRFGSFWPLRYTQAFLII